MSGGLGKPSGKNTGFFGNFSQHGEVFPIPKASRIGLKSPKNGPELVSMCWRGSENKAENSSENVLEWGGKPVGSDGKELGVMGRNWNGTE